jgi:curli biogenesis system outer membrane secretion channel CsgG
MKKILTFFLAFGLLGAFAADDDLPTVFVAPLDGDLTQIQGWQPALGEGLAEMLITELGKLNKFQVLESTALKDLKDEIALGEEGYASKEEKVDKGGFAGADFMFRGKVTRFGSKAQGIGLGGLVPGSGGNLGIKTTTSDVRIDWRFVDAATRKVIKTGQAVGSEKGVGFDIGVAVDGHGGSIGFANEEFMNSALGKATVKALNNIIETVKDVELPQSGRRKAKAAAAAKTAEASKVVADALKNAPGKVLAVPAKGTLIVSLGSKNGFKNGDKAKLYQTVDTKDAQGKVVFSEDKLVGEITLDAVQEERSKASYSGSEEVKEGWTVKAN